jgi:hypothetical protein
VIGRWLSHVTTLARLTVIDATRQRLWLLFVAAAAIVVGFLPGLSAVDDTSRFKLAVVAVTGTLGFVLVLLAILVAAASVRRDVDTRVSFLLFSKPLSPSAYLVGRFMGVQIGLSAGLILLGGISTLVLAWSFSGLPTMRGVNRAVSWEQLGSFGQTLAVDERRTRVQLTGAPGNGMRWHFNNLPRDAGDHVEVLMRVGVRGFSFDDPALDALAQVTAFSSAQTTPRILSLDQQSPYGHARQGGPVPVGQIVVRDRDETRDDLAQDYLRLRLPTDVIAPDGSATIQLTRLEARSAITVTQDSSVLITVSDGHFAVNMLRALAVYLASASLLTAFSLMIAAVTNLGVTFLGGLTLYFAGLALSSMREVADSERTAHAIRRLMQIALEIIPDFDRFTIAARLAAHESIPWNVVLSAWNYYGLYSVIFLVFAWIALRRREL